MAARLAAGATVGDFRLEEWVGRDEVAELWLASKGDPEWLFWVVVSPGPLEPLRGFPEQAQFEAGGHHFLALPVSGTSAATLAGLVGRVSWRFLGPRWVKVAEAAGYFHGHGQSFQKDSPFALSRVVFDHAAQPVLSSVTSAASRAMPFAAPEQSSASTPTATADVYALAAALLALLGEAQPASGAALPGARALDATPMLPLVIQRAMDPAPDQRFASAPILALALRDALARPAARLPRPGRRMVGALVGVALVALLAVGLVAACGRLAASAAPVAAGPTATPRFMEARPGPLVFERLEVVPLAGELQLAVQLSKGGYDLPAGAAVAFEVQANGAPVQASVEPMGTSRFGVQFATQPGEQATYRVAATLDGESATRTIFFSGGDTAETGYSLSAPAVNGPPGLNPLPPDQPTGGEPPDLEGGTTLDTSGVDSAPPGVGRGASFGSLLDLSDVGFQVDTTGYPNMVSYFSLATEDGTPVQLRGALQVEVSVDGQSVQNFVFRPVNRDTDPLTAALVIDISGSMEGAPMAAARDAAATFVGELGDAESVCVYTFSTVVAQAQDCTTHHAAAGSAIAGLAAAGDTALYDVLSTVSGDHAQRPGRQAIIVLSDGADTASGATLDDALAQVQATNLPLYTIGLISEDFDGAVLGFLAQQTGGTFLQAPAIADLQVLYAKIQLQLANQYRLDFQSPLPPNVTSGTVTIRLSDGTETIQLQRRFVVKQ